MECPKAIATDFDFTIARHIGGFEYLYELFTARGVPRDMVVELAGKLSDERGFSIERLIPIVKRELGMRRFWQRLPREGSIVKEFYAATEKHVAAYPGVIDCMRAWRALQIPVHIVTRGEPSYQKFKVDNIVKPPYDFIHVIEPPARKSDALRAMIARYGTPILFVDDRRRFELDEVRDRFSEVEVITVHILRPHDPYGDGPSRYPHHEIHSFEEVLPKFFK